MDRVRGFGSYYGVGVGVDMLSRLHLGLNMTCYPLQFLKLALPEGISRVTRRQYGHLRHGSDSPCALCRQVSPGSIATTPGEALARSFDLSCGLRAGDSTPRACRRHRERPMSVGIIPCHQALHTCNMAPISHLTTAGELQPAYICTAEPC